jgi:hypothetical protein
MTNLMWLVALGDRKPGPCCDRHANCNLRFFEPVYCPTRGY